MSGNVLIHMAEYYRERAVAYESFYGLWEHAEDLSVLHHWLLDNVRGKTVLEVAAGTGYWTRIAATVAACITATDISREALALAEQRCNEERVSYFAADAFRLPD